MEESRRLAVQKAACPICLCDLCEKPQEVGALTRSGRRVESALYHKGCVCPGGEDRPKLLINKVSPISKQKVDGFVLMPPFRERQAWVDFNDWNRDGQLSVNELAQAVAAVLPVDENSCEKQVAEWFDVDKDGSISQVEMSSRVLPWLEANTQVLAARRSAPTLSASSSDASCMAWFDYHDADGSGSLDASELRFALTACFVHSLGLFQVDLETQECIIQGFLDDADDNGDQSISKQEFLARMAPALRRNLGLIHTV